MCNASTREAEAGVCGQPGIHSQFWIRLSCVVSSAFSSPGKKAKEVTNKNPNNPPIQSAMLLRIREVGV